MLEAWKPNEKKEQNHFLHRPGRSIVSDREFLSQQGGHLNKLFSHLLKQTIMSQSLISEFLY